MLFWLRNALHEVEFSSSLLKALQQLTTPLQSATLLQQFSSYFFENFTRAHVHIFVYISRGYLSQHFQLGVARQVTEKIAQCNKAFRSVSNLANSIFSCAEYNSNDEEQQNSLISILAYRQR